MIVLRVVEAGRKAGASPNHRSGPGAEQCYHGRTACQSTILTIRHRVFDDSEAGIDVNAAAAVAEGPGRICSTKRGRRPTSPPRNKMPGPSPARPIHKQQAIRLRYL